MSNPYIPNGARFYVSDDGVCGTFVGDEVVTEYIEVREVGSPYARRIPTGWRLAEREPAVNLARWRCTYCLGEREGQQCIGCGAPRHKE